MPQPSPAWPQNRFCCAQVLGVQVSPTPHWPGKPPPPQVCPVGQLPHWMTLPQPSPVGPQLYPSFEQVLGTQPGAPQTPGTPPPPQKPVAQGPHWITLPQ